MAKVEEVEVVFTPHPLDAVERGMEWLDEHVPGWRKQRPTSFGQVRALYAAAMRNARRRPWTGSTAEYYGFDAKLARAYFALGEAWREELATGSHRGSAS
jgi:hypothetical protein